MQQPPTPTTEQTCRAAALAAEQSAQQGDVLAAWRAAGQAEKACGGPPADSSTGASRTARSWAAAAQAWAIAADEDWELEDVLGVAAFAVELVPGSEAASSAIRAAAAVHPQTR